ncbi:MAG: MFS transporter [Novosphingobium sp.]|nr:MFS transporter [Novosphingobium sp.]
MTALDKAAMRQEWRGGWPVVLASAAGMSLTPLTTYTMGVFVTPLEEEFGWSRAFIATGLTVNAVTGVLLSVFVGALVDRFGPRRIAIPGVILFCVTFGLLSTTSGASIHWWLLWLGVSFGALMLKVTVWTWAIVSRFTHARGLALATALSGTAITGMISPFLAEFLIQNFGWRWAYVGLAAAFCAIVLPLVLAFFFGANDLVRTSTVPTSMPNPTPLSGLTVKDALASATYWKVALGTFMVILTIMGSVVHFVPILVHGGLERGGAITAAGAMGVAAFCGRLLAGFMLDRLNAKIIGGTAFLLPGLVAGALLAFEGDLIMAIAIALVMGSCIGAEIEVSSYLSSRHFGLRNFGTLFGIIGGLIALAGGVAPPLAGHMFDLYGSYDLALMAGAVLSVAAGVLLFTLPAYPENFGPEKTSTIS